MSMTGAPVIYGINPHTASSDQKHPLGTMGVTNDGRTYRYAQNAGSNALSPGKLCQAPDITGHHEDRPVNSFLVNDKTMSVALGATAITGNEYEEGFVNVTDETGEGIMYKIKSCPPTDSSGTVLIELAEPIIVAAHADATVTLYRNKYRDIVITAQASDQAVLPVGVPNVTIAADYYGWIQTGGPCSILIDSQEITVGKPITVGSAVDGAVESLNAATEPPVGFNPAGVDADAGEYGVFELTLD